MPATPLLNAEVRFIDAERGHGVFATAAMPAGTTIFKEQNLVAIQHKSNKAAGPVLCERCFRFLGPLEDQMRALLRASGKPDSVVPAQLPQVEGMRPMPSPVWCGGLQYCSEACRAAAFSEGHQLICPTVPPAAAAAGDDAMQVDAGPSSSAASTGSGGGEAWAKFEEHALATNEIFLMAARAAALIVVRVNAGQELAQAGSEFVGVPWWESVARPDDVPPEGEAAFRQAMRDALVQSWELLVPVLAPHAPPGLALLTAVDGYASIVGSFERRNCDMQVASPVEEYFLLVDDLEDGPQKEAITAVTQPILDALDASYDTAGEGIGLFPLQATLNHSCAPNVWLKKEEGEDEEDGRVVAVLKTDVAAGDELCNSYIDVELPFAQRQRELAEYGFVCACARCLAEKPAASRPARKLK